MENIYKNPESNILQDEYGGKLPEFSNLGIWRKIYIVFNWVFGLLILIPGVFGLVQSENEDLTDRLLYLAVAVLYMGYCYWLHVAISKRRLSQLIAILIIQIFPFVNPVSALIMFFIYRTSKNENIQ